MRRPLALCIATVVALFTSVIAAVPTIGAQDDLQTVFCDGREATIVLDGPGNAAWLDEAMTANFTAPDGSGRCDATPAKAGRLPRE